METYMETLGCRAKEASRAAAKLTTVEKNRGLEFVAEELCLRKEELLSENEKDMEAAREQGMSEALQDRLRLTQARIEAMAEGLRQIAGLSDPIGEVLSMKNRPNGLRIGKKRVPLGVVGIIYESRPNVTADAFGLCFKTGNAVILRGGSDAINSRLSQDLILLVEDTSRAVATEMMRLHEYIDVLIPRGGAGLISTVVQNSTVPVIETGTGNCHIYVDESVDVVMAAEIIENAKTQRLGVPASEEDWGMEYLDAIISVKTVASLDEAIRHINRYNTGHSEAIITKDYDSALRFQDEIDAAAVYVNASTRFTDGFEFGFGAEIGISTQKLHARGPMGLEALTTTKYIIFGNGQIRK